MSTTWRERFRPRIAEWIAEADRRELTGRDRLKFVSVWAWPSAAGARANWPYRAFLAELKHQLGGKRRKPVDRPMPLFDRPAD